MVKPEVVWHEDNSVALYWSGFSCDVTGSELYPTETLQYPHHPVPVLEHLDTSWPNTGMEEKKC